MNSKENKIYILVLITVMDRAGAETMMMNYLRNIDRDKYHLDFMINRPDRAPYENEIESLGSKVYHISAIAPFRIRKYKKEFREFVLEHPEYTVIHSHLEERSCYALDIAKEIGIPIRIAHAHSRLKRKNIKYLMRLYLRKKLKGTYTHSFACSKNSADWLFGKNNNAQIIKNAIDTKEFSYNEESRKKAREEIGIDNDTLLIGHVGRFCYEKNHKFLIEIFNHLNKQNPNSKLLLIGGGDNKNEKIIKQKIIKKVKKLGLEDKVILLGVRDDMSYIMQAIDVILLPSFSEGFPMTLVEGQSLGLRCLVSDNVTKDTNITGQLRYFSLKSTASEWAEQILDFAGQTMDQKKMNELVKESGYDITDNVKILEKIYQEEK